MYTLARPLVAVSLLLLAGFALLAAPPAWAEEGAPRVERAAVTVRFDPPRQRLLAEATLDVDAVANGVLRLDLAPVLRITEVSIDGASRGAPLRDGQGGFEVPVPAGKHRVLVVYRGRLHDEVKAAEDLAWVAGDSTRGLVAPVGIFLTGGSRWIPWSEASPLVTVDVTAWAPKEMVVVCQGGVPTRTSLEVTGFDASGDALVPADGAADGTTSWVRSTFPGTIPTDGVSLSAGDYVVTSREVEGVTISTYFYPRHQQYAPLWLDSTEATVKRYASILGTYPHPKFDVVENFFQSGYGMPSFTLLGDKVIEYVSAKAMRGGGIPPGYLDHEYVHGWYGNGLFVDYVRGNWCEAITTYLSNYYAVELAGGGPESQEAIDHRRGVMERFCLRVHGEADIPLRAFTTKKEDSDNDIGYGKGSLFFHMIRRATAPDDAAWWSTLAAFTKENTGKVVLWQDWARAWRPEVGVGPFEQMAPWLDRPGLPLYALKFASAAPLDAAAPEGPHEVQVVVTETSVGAPFGGTLPFVVHGGEGESAWSRSGVVTMVDREGTARLRVPHRPTRVELDPAWHVARAIPKDELPLCLQGTLRAPGTGVIVVRGDEVAFGGLGQKLERSTGWTVVGPDYDLTAHDGPAIVLWLLEPGETAAPLQGQSLSGPASSLLATVSWNGHPRTWYVAASAQAAARAGYVPFYGWDTWVRFEGGIPVGRAVVRPPSRSTTYDLRAPEEQARLAADGVVKHMASADRSPGTEAHAALQAWLAARVPFPPLDMPHAQAGNDAFQILETWTAPKVTLRYTGGHRQGSLTDSDFRPVVFGADHADGAWRAVGEGSNRIAIVTWTDGDPAALWQDAHLRSRNGSAGVIYVVEDAIYDAMAPWLDRAASLTEAGQAQRDKKGRDGQRAHTGPIALWLSGRRAHLGLPFPEPLPMPVVVARRKAMPASPDEAQNPFAWIEEVALELDVKRTTRPARNLVFHHRAPGIESNGRRPAVLLLAHYDALPWGEPEGRTYPGADDNASGVACLLDVARRVAEGQAKPGVDLLIAFPDAEEWGLLGSTKLVDALKDRFRLDAVVSVDSVGRGLSQPTYVIGQSIHTDLGTALTTAIEAEGIEKGKDIDRFAFAHGSDHWPFHQAGIPAVSLWASDYAVMNRPVDTIDGVEPEGIVRLARAITRWLDTFR
ncbi:MAG: M20/M25/M40 family metallo-hydrolase [Planctomycetota bacterium]